MSPVCVASVCTARSGRLLSGLGCRWKMEFARAQQSRERFHSLEIVLCLESNIAPLFERSERVGDPLPTCERVNGGLWGSPAPCPARSARAEPADGAFASPHRKMRLPPTVLPAQLARRTSRSRAALRARFRLLPKEPPSPGHGDFPSAGHGNFPSPRHGNFPPGWGIFLLDGAFSSWLGTQRLCSSSSLCTLPDRRSPVPICDYKLAA